MRHRFQEQFNVCGEFRRVRKRRSERAASLYGNHSARDCGVELEERIGVIYVETRGLNQCGAQIMMLRRRVLVPAAPRECLSGYLIPAPFC